ncbi:hypothetical protein ACM53J_005223 [Escherichia coli]|uniref:hypothetical protein n=1 Tax=Escherichia coli TaxID=562 RepID=UPI000F428FA6|nr:hypothetical protein [Escherichia coli]RNI67717.1 hypothetical protein EFV12_25565 [Escherichia coli]
MRIKYESRWKLEELKQKICSSIDTLMDKYDVEYATGINLYMNCEDKEFNLVDIVNEDGNKIMFVVSNNEKIQKPKKSTKKKTPAPVIELDKYRKK